MNFKFVYLIVLIALLSMAWNAQAQDDTNNNRGGNGESRTTSGDAQTGDVNNNGMFEGTLITGDAKSGDTQGGNGTGGDATQRMPNGSSNN